MFTRTYFERLFGERERDLGERDRDLGERERDLERKLLLLLRLGGELWWPLSYKSERFVCETIH